MVEKESKTVGMVKAAEVSPLEKAEAKVAKAEAALEKAQADLETAYSEEFGALSEDARLKRWRECWLWPHLACYPGASTYTDGTPLDSDIIPKGYKGEKHESLSKSS